MLFRSYPQSTTINTDAPCLILKAMGWLEGGWQQANGNIIEGGTGGVKVSPSCGYGIMQITSGMRAPGELPLDVQNRIATDYRYNVAYGAKLLAEKWNAGDSLGAVVGSRDPKVGEHWYYAVWAYNQFTFKNNPNNPDYAWPRPAFDGTQSRIAYPYQETIWGFAANPPKRNGAPLWPATPLTLPDRGLISQTPGPIPAPSDTHSVACLAVSVTPGAVTWRVVPGAGVQTAKITLNGGPGKQNWQVVVKGESWLTVSPPAGDTLPVELTLTAQPGGLSLGSHTAVAQFSLEGVATEVKALAELVILSESKLFLPIVPKRSTVPR